MNTYTTSRTSKRKDDEKGRGNNSDALAEAARKGDSILATQQAAALARRGEVLEAQRNGGFNAFQPHMSFSSASGGGVGAAPIMGTAVPVNPNSIIGGGGAESNVNDVGLPLSVDAVGDTDLAMGLLLSVEVGTCTAVPPVYVYELIAMK